MILSEFKDRHWERQAALYAKDKELHAARAAWWTQALENIRRRHEELRKLEDAIAARVDIQKHGQCVVGTKRMPTLSETHPDCNKDRDYERATIAAFKAAAQDIEVDQVPRSASSLNNACTFWPRSPANDLSDMGVIWEARMECY